MTKHHFPTTNQKLTKSLMKLQRLPFSRLIQFMSGHCFLGRHNSITKWGFVNYEDALCSYCDEDVEESALHILAECDNFVVARVQHFGSDVLEHPFGFKNITSLQSFLRATDIVDIRDWEPP